jgi:hypothetical protein
MKVSFHRRRHDSLPPQPRRSPRVLLVAAVLVLGSTTLAAAGLGRTLPPVDPEVAAAEQATRDIVDERVRAHLRSRR